MPAEGRTLTSGVLSKKRQCASRASILPGEKRQSEFGGGGDPPRRKLGPPQTIDDAGLFCVCESRLSHRSPIFFFRSDRQRVASVQCHVARHAAGLIASDQLPC